MDPITQMYTHITMPESCEKRIRKAIREKEMIRPAPKRRLIPVLSLLLAAAMILCLAGNSQVQAALGKVVDHVFGKAPDNAALPYFVEVDGAEIYLCLGEERTDITDAVSRKTPYIYSYEDLDNKEHILIIGGTAEALGYCEFIIEEGQWIRGSSEGYLDPVTYQPLPWVQAAWDILKIPFPLPGDAPENREAAQ